MNMHYHRVWLEAHPGWDWARLQSMLDLGFEVHRLDGDRTNNAPENLVLMEHDDHMRLRDLPMMNFGMMPRKSRGPHKRTLVLGKTAYEHKLENPSESWRRVGEFVLNWNCHSHARIYARHNNLAWPIP